MTEDCRRAGRPQLYLNFLPAFFFFGLIFPGPYSKDSTLIIQDALESVIIVIHSQLIL